MFDSVPIFDTRGNLVATGTQLWSGDLLSPPEYDQYGDLFGGLVWTGSLPDGSIAPLPLGTEGSSYFGDLVYWQRVANGSTIAGFTCLTALCLRYMVSRLPSQSSPEPATLTLLGTALLGLGVVYLRRRGAKTMIGVLLAVAFLASAATVPAQRPTCSTWAARGTQRPAYGRARRACNLFRWATREWQIQQ